MIVYLGLRLRGQTWAHFGLTFGKPRRTTLVRTLFLSLAVFAAATAAFVLGSIVMANISGIPESADMSGYNYIYQNLPLLIISLIGVYIVSSFGEEVIYRAFLITRIEEMAPAAKKCGGSPSLSAPPSSASFTSSGVPSAWDRLRLWGSSSPSPISK